MIFPQVPSCLTADYGWFIYADDEDTITTACTCQHSTCRGTIEHILKPRPIQTSNRKPKRAKLGGNNFPFHIPKAAASQPIRSQPQIKATRNACSSERTNDAIAINSETVTGNEQDNATLDATGVGRKVEVASTPEASGVKKSKRKVYDRDFVDGVIAEIFGPDTSKYSEQTKVAIAELRKTMC